MKIYAENSIGERSPIGPWPKLHSSDKIWHMHSIYGIDTIILGLSVW